MKSNRRGNNLFKKLEDNFILQVLVCVVLSTIVVLGFLVINNDLNEQKFHEYTITEDMNLINNIENVSLEDGNIVLKGFAFLLDKDSKDSSISLFLRNTNNGKEVWFDVQQNARNDLNSYFDSGYNNINSGFLANTNAGKLHSDECYEVIINIDYFDTDGKKARKTVSSNKYLVNGIIYDYNPEEFDEPDMNIKSDLLREVFTKGKVCFYKKAEGMYVYQYDKKLYYITTKDFVFDKSGTIIYCHLYTSQVNKLPSESIPNKFEYRDFNFEQQEYKEENTAPYRVAICDISADYAITNINTGIYDRVSNMWKKLEPFEIEYSIGGQ